MVSALKSVLVVGATGGTGRWVVQHLLDRGHDVHAVVRSSEKLDGLISGNKTRLHVTEGTVLDLDDDEVRRLVSGRDAIVSCLGHTMDRRGIYGKPRRLVTDTARRLCSAAAAAAAEDSERRPPSSSSPPLFVLMGTDAVPNPDGGPSEPRRTLVERAVLAMLRRVLPPHVDNERAAAYLREDLGTGDDGVDWTIVRPTNLIDADVVSDYEVTEGPRAGLFNMAHSTTRINAADFMVQLVLDDELRRKWKFGWPVVMDRMEASS